MPDDGPWANYQSQDQEQGPWQKYGASPPVADNSTIGPTPTGNNLLPSAESHPPTKELSLGGTVKRYSGLEGIEDAAGRVGSAISGATTPIENYTQQGRQEHPFLSRLGDVTHGTKELLTGGQSAGKPMGTSSGLLDNPVTMAMSAAPGAADLAAGVERGITRMRNPLARAGKLYERAVVPGGVSAEDQALVRDEFSRGAKHIGQYTKNTPLEGGEGGALRSSQTVRQARQNLWDENVAPAVDNYAQAQRPMNDVASQIRNSYNNIDRTTKPGVVEAGEKFAQMFDRPMSVREMSDTVTDLNNDKAVIRYNNMDDLSRTQAEMADPSLRAKVKGLDALRGKLFDTIAEEGGESLGAGFESARKDWGALRSMEERLRNVKVPTPQPVMSRLANTARTLVTPKGLDFYLHPPDTMMGLSNPNRLATKSLNLLGKAGLEAPEPVGRMTPFMPPQRLLGPAPTRLGSAPDTSGPVDLGQPHVERGTDAVLRGRLLGPAPKITPPSGYSTPIGSEAGGPLEEHPMHEAPAISQKGISGKFERGYSSSTGPQQKGTRLGQIAKVGEERWTWDGDRWSRMQR